MEIRNRIREFRLVKGSELRHHPRNWRKHPPKQRKAFRALLDEIGFAGVELVYQSERFGGELTIIDGHMRQEEVGDFEMPCAITDLTDAEADKLLALANPLAAMADTDPEKLDELLQEIDTGSAELQELLADVAKEAGLYPDGEVGGEPPESNYSEQYGVIVMCDGEAQQKEIYEALLEQGYNCKVVVT